MSAELAGRTDLDAESRVPGAHTLSPGTLDPMATAVANETRRRKAVSAAAEFLHRPHSSHDCSSARVAVTTEFYDDLVSGRLDPTSEQRKSLEADRAFMRTHVKVRVS